MKRFLFFLFLLPSILEAKDGLPLFYWKPCDFVNFGDYLSLKVVERIVERPVQYSNKRAEKKLLAIGSVIRQASNDDVVWGSGLNLKHATLKEFKFKNLDVRAVRGPLTRKFLMEHLHINCPETYGDPALLIPYLFPEFKKAKDPLFDYIIIPHYSDISLFPKSKYPNAVYPTEPWNIVIEKILNSKFVISSSLHGIVVAEAFGIPARLLKTSHEPLFKYRDYYLGTGRTIFKRALNIDEALILGGEKPFQCDLKKLYLAFPFEFWKNIKIKQLPL